MTIPFKKQFLFIFLLLLALSSHLLAFRMDFPFESINIDKGLSQNSAKCIFQDKAGYLWIGTENGLNRYDGYQIRTFTSPEGLEGVIINDIIQDDPGFLWIATMQGLYNFDPQSAKFSLVPLQKDRLYMPVRSLCQIDKHLIWIGTEAGVWELNTNNFAKRLVLQGENLKIFTIKKDSRQNIWLGTSAGLYGYNIDSENWVTRPAQNPFSKTKIFSLLPEANRGLWVGTAEHGLFLYSPSQNTHKKVHDPAVKSKATVKAILRDSNGSLWFGYQTQGLSRFQPRKKEWLHFTGNPVRKDALNSNSILALFEDRSGVLWIGTNGGGMNRTKIYSYGFTWYKTLINKENETNANMVFAFAEENKNEVWVGTWDGLFKFDRQTEMFTRYPANLRPEEESLKIFSLFKDRKQRVWIGAQLKGLYRVDRTKGLCVRQRTILNNDENLGHESIYSIIEDSSGYLWLGSSKGLYRWQPQQDTFLHFQYNPQDSTALNCPYVRSLLIDSSGQLWLGTLGGGLNRLLDLNGHFKHYLHEKNKDNTLSNNFIYSLEKGDSNHIWVGAINGLNKFDPLRETFHNLFKDRKPSPSDKLVYTTVCDTLGNIWVGTAHGLMRVKRHSFRIKIFLKENGLQDNEFNAGAGLKTWDGKIFIGGINGFNAFDPGRIRKNRKVFPTLINDFQVFDVSIYTDLFRQRTGQPPRRPGSRLSKIVLDYKNTFFTIYFSHPSFYAPKKQRYLYRLDGYEKDWHMVRGRNWAEYSNVPPGNYEFIVKGGNIDDSWDTHGVRLKIIITPPFWRTWWFHSLLFLLVVLIVLWAHHIRTRYFRKRNAELQKINTQLENEIAERLKFQAALEESERRMHTLIGNLPGMAFRCYNDTTRTLKFASDGCILLTGYTPQELINNQVLSFASLIYPEERDVILKKIKTATEHHEPFQATYRILTKLKTVKWVWEKSVGIFDNKGRLQAVEGFIADVTHQKSLEEQLVQAQKMEAVGHLAGGVAHDFNNLLTVIRGYSDLTLALLEPTHPVYKKIMEISKTVDRAEALTGQLLSFSRKQVIQPKAININNQINETRTMLGRLIGEHIRLETLLEAKPAIIKADPGQLEQVLLNLTINARDAMLNGGTLTIQTQNVTIEDDFSGIGPDIPYGEYILLSVSDTGSGMDSETLSCIFDPFFTTKEKGKGTGLGLATVYGIVKQNGGYIMVNSQLGAGTTFFIYFPLSRDESVLIGELPAGKQSLGGDETLLLVEDRHEVREVLGETLKRLGYHIIEAADGIDALAVASKTQKTIHVLITDVVMPRMNGKELAQKLKELRPDIKTIFMSGYTDDMLGSEGKIDQDILFIQKPFRAEALAQIIRKAIRQR